MTHTSAFRPAGRRVLVAAASMVLGTGFAAEPAASVDGPHVPLDPIDEVVVKGLRELRRAAIKAEDRMLARYNELNRDRDLAIVCTESTGTATHLSQRYCKLRLQQRMEERDAWSFMTAMTSQDVQGGAGGAAPSPTPLAEVRVQLMHRADDFRDNLEELLRNNPDLRELVHQSSVAYRQYEDRFNKDKPANGR